MAARVPVLRFMRSRRAVLSQIPIRAGLLVALLWGSRAYAQTATGVVGTSVIVDVALTGAAEQDLDFTKIAPGVPKSVATQDIQACPDACTAGRWRFQNISKKAVDHRANMQFSALPDSLVGPGGAKLGIAYSARGCVYTRATNTSMGCVSQAVTQGSTVVLPINNVAGAIGDTSPATPRDIYLWIGGTANPLPSQRAGTYVGVVTVFFFYN